MMHRKNQVTGRHEREITCRHCGGQFWAVRRDAKTCSILCRKALSRDQQKPVFYSLSTQNPRCDPLLLTWTKRARHLIEAAWDEKQANRDGSVFLAVALNLEHAARAARRAPL